VKPAWLLTGVAVAALLAATVAFPDQPGAPLGIVLRGAVFGVGNGLLAVGLVLTYRTTRIINFAYGAMGGVGGGLAAALTLGQGWPWPLAALVGIATGALVGAATERLVIRRFVNAPRLVLTVATIGLAQLLGGITLFMPGWFGAQEIIPGFDTALSDRRWTIDPSTFDGNDVLLVAVVPLVLAGLVWFLRGTDAGTAVRGMAENMDRARLVGIPVNQLSLLLWTIGGGLAALTVVLKAPNEGVSFDAAAGPTILLPALAAAVVTGMRSMPAAFVAGVLVGVADQVVAWNVERRATTYVVLLLVVVVGLLVQPKPTNRARTAGESSWSLSGGGRRLPPALARLPEVRVAKAAMAAVVAAVLVVIPVVGSPSQVNTATLALTFGLAALSLVVLTGWGGVVSLGQVALVGVGGVVMANALAEWGIDTFVALVVCAVGGALVALALGLPALRVSGELLAVTTLAFAVAMQLFILNPANFEWLIPQSYSRPELFGRIDLSDERWVYALALAVLAVAVFVVSNLRASRTGRVIAAARDNERSAAAAGVNTTETRLMAFVVAGMFAGVAGGIHAITLRGIGLNTYEAADSLLVFSMAVIGGVGSIGGTLAGVALIEWLGYAFPRFQLLLTGVGLLVILMVLPGGLAQFAERVRDRYASLFGHRHGLEPVEQLHVVDQEGRVGAGTHLPAEVTGSGLMAGAAARHKPLLVCRGVEASYGTLQVLFGIDTAVTDDDMLALLGTNGAGKSTLLKAIVGLLPPTEGKITFQGEDITGLPAEKIARKGISLMPGGKGVFPTLTVEENLQLSCWMLRGDARAVREAKDDVLAMFPILRDRWDQMAGDLSGGEQQQLSLAMAFVVRPKLLCIDELSLGLAPTIVAQLVDKVHEMHARGTSIVVVEQSINVALLLCDRALFLEKGQVRFRGHTDGLLDQPDILRAVFIGAGQTPAETSGVAPETIAIEDRTTRGVTLECHQLTKRFGGIRAVDRVDLVIPPSSIVGLIGHNGAGKTTLFDVLTGYLKSDGGRVLLNGQDITDLPPHKRAVAEVGRSFQEARLFPSLTVADAIRVALDTHLASREPVAAALRLPASTLSERSAGRRVDELIELLGLGQYRDRPTGDLSTGTRRIVELACLLAQDPAVVLLDEPSAGVAQRETEALGPLLRDVQAETGCSMVVIEHDMALLASLCDYFVALEQGGVIASGRPDEVLADPLVVASYLGTNDDVVARSGERREARARNRSGEHMAVATDEAPWAQPEWTETRITGWGGEGPRPSGPTSPAHASPSGRGPDTDPGASPAHMARPGAGRPAPRGDGPDGRARSWGNEPGPPTRRPGASYTPPGGGPAARAPGGSYTPPGGGPAARPGGHTPPGGAPGVGGDGRPGRRGPRPGLGGPEAGRPGGPATPAGPDGRPLRRGAWPDLGGPADDRRPTGPTPASDGRWSGPDDTWATPPSRPGAGPAETPASNGRRLTHDELWGTPGPPDAGGPGAGRPAGPPPEPPAANGRGRRRGRGGRDMWSSPPSGGTPAVPGDPGPPPADRRRDDFDAFWDERRPGDWAQSGDDLWEPGPAGGAPGDRWDEPPAAPSGAPGSWPADDGLGAPPTPGTPPHGEPGWPGEGAPARRRAPDGGGWSEADGVDGRGTGGVRRGSDWSEPDADDGWRPPD
jgi:ABC-type branched-subunit amino acid transport system ATPase component/ABC-type branched-subunit amino acid transport system permease subunit